MKALVIALLIVLITACASGPDYRAPTAPVAAARPFSGTTSPAVVATEPRDAWWKLYDDPVLNGLVSDALAANTDIRVAIAHLERARASLQGARAERLPQTSVGLSGGYERIPKMNAIPGQPRDTAIVDGEIAVAYDVDLFGRVRRSIEAARADSAAAEADVAAVRVVIVSDTTRAYVDAAAAAQQLNVARRTSELLDQSLHLTTRRFEAGRAAKFDVLRIGALRSQQQARIPELEARRQAALFRLATLTGRTPQDLPDFAKERESVPDIASPIPVGDGLGLLQRRPDVRAAERRLAANTARIGVATADLYPHISLGGAVGQTSPGFGSFLGAGTLGFLAGPLINWTFPNQVAIRSRIAAANADTRASLAEFDGVVLRALEEAEIALSAYAKTLDQRNALQEARDRADAAAQIVRHRQSEGQVDFLEVLDAERTAAQADAELATADGRVADAQVTLFKALGGGWRSEADRG